MELIVRIKKRLHQFTLNADIETKSSIALLGASGSGKSMIPDALKKGAQVYITGDIDHHTGIDATAQGLAVIDAGHYGTEYIFMEAVSRKLSSQFPELKVSCARIVSPYTLL